MTLPAHDRDRPRGLADQTRTMNATTGRCAAPVQVTLLDGEMPAHGGKNGCGLKYLPYLFGPVSALHEP